MPNFHRANSTMIVLPVSSGAAPIKLSRTASRRLYVHGTQADCAPGAPWAPVRCALVRTPTRVATTA